MQLLSKLLEFNPQNRLSAKELLEMDYFDDIRDLEQEEITMNKKIQLAVDYTQNSNNLEQQSEDEYGEMLQIQQSICEIALHYQRDKF